MDDRIQELLERARETAATAGEYAGQMVDTARLRGRLFALRTDINGLLHTAGRLVSVHDRWSKQCRSVLI